MPININIGVIKNPPPTPNSPDINPTNKPENNKKIMLISTPAIGRKISII